MNIDILWILVSAALVFFMQAGFKCLEVGMVRTQHTISVAVKNIIDWVVVSLAFLALGFGLIFGQSSGGLFGTNNFFLNGINDPNSIGIGWAFYLFQFVSMSAALFV